MKMKEYFYSTAKLTILSVIQHEISQLGGIKNLVISGFKKYILPMISKVDPSINITSIEEFITEIKKDGNAKDAIIHEILKEQEKCATSSGIEIKELEKLASCMLKLPNSTTDSFSKAQSFASCAGINLVNLPLEIQKFSGFITCVAEDLRSASAEIRKIATKLSQDMDLNHFSEAISKLEQGNYFQEAFQSKLMTAADTCSHTIGSDQEHTAKKIICLGKSVKVKGGAMQKVQALIKCDNITSDNVFDEVHNSIALVQCLGKTFEDQITSSITVDPMGI